MIVSDTFKTAATEPPPGGAHVAVMWHMHQPWYRDAQDGAFSLPWVWLHAIKDYADMIALLEAQPAMRCTVNFAPILLEQIDEYARRLTQWQQHHSEQQKTPNAIDHEAPTGDVLLDALLQPATIPNDAHGRARLVQVCTRAFRPRMIDPWPEFCRRLDLAIHLAEHRQNDLELLPQAFFHDLVARYVLAWCGVSVRKTYALDSLLNSPVPIAANELSRLIAALRDTLATLLSRYRSAAERGQIELSMTPYAHPIVPLLLDFSVMHCARPDAPEPTAPGYPHGEPRARWHFDEGLSVFEQHFGRRPDGVWLSEGALSDDAVRLADQYGFVWAASGESVWAKSRHRSGLPVENEARRTLFTPHQLPGCQIRLLFRDDGLSDAIGFIYKDMPAEQAVSELLTHLENIARFAHDQHEPSPIVSIVLDGENAWEYYDNNGWDFLTALYDALAKHPLLIPVTLSEAARLTPAEPLPELCAGSWVHGTLDTWIGEPAKNRAWDLLVDAKRAVDRITAERVLSADDRRWIERQLAICEGSDWFWWFAEGPVAAGAHDFDALYRQQLRQLYQRLGLPIPPNVDQPLLGDMIGHVENAGTMQRGQPG
ncbi:MAG: glycoside hydrolase [Thioalkalivibrionaceae bacterium]